MCYTLTDNGLDNYLSKLLCFALGDQPEVSQSSRQMASQTFDKKMYHKVFQIMYDMNLIYK